MTMTLSQKFKFLDQFEEQIKTLKTVLSHVGLYVGLIAYTALGAWIFQMLEFPDEEDRMTTLQELVIYEREDFLKTIYNLTSGLNPDQFEALKSYIFYGPDFDASDYDVRTIMLNTNRLVPPIPPHGYSSQMTNIPEVDDVINKLEDALSSYEKTVSVAASEGLDIATKEINYEWTYVQSVFFTSTIITTVGYGNMAPVTTSGRAFCILFAIIGIPFTLSVIADVGQIFATLVSTVWGKIKPILDPIMDYAKHLKKRLTKKRRRMRSGGSTNKPQPPLPGSNEKDSEAQGLDEEGEDKEDDKESEDSEEEEDPMASMGIGANIVMAFIALASLAIFLSMGSYFFTNYEEWSFFDSFYFCFITMTTIGFGDMVPAISADKTSYMFMCMIYILVGLAFTSTIIELVRRQYAESWRKMQELRAQIQAQLKLADHLRKMGEQGRDLEGMDVDLDELRANLSKYKKFGFNISDLDWIDERKKIKAVTIFFYETSV